MEKQEKLIQEFTEWAKQEKDILSAILVGSFARNSAREDSDVDFVVITNKPQELLSKSDWIKSLGSVKSIEEEDYGLVQSRRVFYENGIEVEFGITTIEWLKIPINSGTKKVLSDGYKVLDDKANLFTNLSLE